MKSENETLPAKKGEDLPGQYYGAYDDDPGDQAMGGQAPDEIFILQSNSVDPPPGGEVGQWCDSKTGKYFDSLNVLVLRVGMPSQALFKGKYVSGQRPTILCRSSNGVTPDGGEAPLPGPCRERSADGKWSRACPKLEWVDGEKPPCQENYSVLCWVPELGGLRFYSVRRTSIPPFQKMRISFTRIAKSGDFNSEAKIDVHPKFFVPIRFGSANKGTHFEPTFDIVTSSDGWADEDTAKQIAEAYSAVIGQ